MSQPAAPGQPWPGGDGFEELPEQWLRARPGVKWAQAAGAELAAWVADMDFPAPGPARRALAGMAAVGDLGYGFAHEEKLEASWSARMKSLFDWAPAPGRLRLFGDLVQAVQVFLHVLTGPGDGVLVLTPSYPPFVSTPAEMGRPLLAVPAYPSPGGWSFDLDQARSAAPRARALLLVNPHNPTGRSLSADELAALGELAEAHDLVVISDEIHAELLLSPSARHIPFASLSGDLAERTITLYSASKAFNLGGMCCAVAHVGPEKARAALAGLPSHLFGRPSTTAVATTLACWSPEGDRWLSACLGRLRANRELMSRWLSGPGGAAGARGTPPEATYLQWLDFTGTKLAEAPARLLRQTAGVWLSEGHAFGPGGDGFARLNFATTPGVLTELLDRITSGLT
jgi:cysteine-S-conjugate beta-lyase